MNIRLQRSIFRQINTHIVKFETVPRFCPLESETKECDQYAATLKCVIDELTLRMNGKNYERGKYNDERDRNQCSSRSSTVWISFRHDEHGDHIPGLQLDVDYLVLEALLVSGTVRNPPNTVHQVDVLRIVSLID